MLLQGHTTTRRCGFLLLWAVCGAPACAGEHEASTKKSSADDASQSATASISEPVKESNGSTSMGAAKSATLAVTDWEFASRRHGSAQPGWGDPSEMAAANAANAAAMAPILAARASELAAFDDDTPPPRWTDPGGKDSIVPLCEGLTIVTAVASQGDYESIKIIESVTPTAYRLRYSSEAGPAWWRVRERKLAQVVTHRNVLLADGESAHRYHHIFVTTREASDTAPGSTAIGTSGSVLRALKSEGEAKLSLCDTALDSAALDANGRPAPIPGGCFSFSSPFVIKRVGSAPERLSVLVDGVPTELPAVRARGTAWSASLGAVNRIEFLFLDDERNPLTLAFRLGVGAVPALPPLWRAKCEAARRGEATFNGEGMSCDLPDGGDRDTLRVVKIGTRCQMQNLAGDAGPGGGGGGGAGAGAAEGSPASGGRAAGGAGSGSGHGAAGGQSGGLERALSESGTIDVYSIYFSFNSDAIREESEPTLKEIADILTRRPDWKLGITGHTDSVASDSYNLELSQRRAAAVKQALVARYAINADRLQTAGRGERSPKDTNDTLEGRARNRRVELVRLR